MGEYAEYLFNKNLAISLNMPYPYVRMFLFSGMYCITDETLILKFPGICMWQGKCRDIANNSK